MTKSEAYNKLMGFKKIFPSACKEIDEMYEALTSDDKSKKVVVETGDYNADILSLIWTYGLRDDENEYDFIKLDKLIVDSEYSIDKVYVRDNYNVPWLNLFDNDGIGVTLSSLDSDMQIKVCEEVKRTISKTIFEPKIIEYINSLGQYDGVGYEWCLERCVTLIFNHEEVNIMRLVIEDGRLVCHALKDNDETTFIWFDCLPFEVQEEIYDI